MNANADDTTPATSADTGIGYADAMAEIDAILAELEDDSIDIDVLHERVARAAELIALCKGRITAAQQQVSSVVESMRESAGTVPDST